MKKSLMLISLFLITTTSYAITDFISIVELENHIENNVRRKVSHLASENDVIISTQITQKKLGDKTKKKPSKIEVSPLSKFDLYDEEDLEKNLQEEGVKIDKINVSLYFSSTLAPEVKANVQEILKKTLSKFGEYKITYSFEEYTKTVPAPIKKEVKPFYETHMQLISFAIFGFLLFLVALFGISKFQKVGLLLIKALEGMKPQDSETIASAASSSSTMSSSTTTLEGESIDSETSIKESQISTAAENESMEIIMAKTEGVKKFIAYIEDDTSKAANQIRKWQFEKTEASQDAISLVLKSLGFKELKTFMLEFTPEEKKVLKLSMQVVPSVTALKHADFFILEQMTSLVIEPGYIEDSELSKSLYSADMDNLIHISENNPELGADLLAILPKGIADDVCQNLSEETFASVMSESLNFSKEKLQNNFSELKRALRTAKQAELAELSPILDSTTSMLKKASPEKENIIINILAKTKTQDDFRTIMINNFPRELFGELSDDVKRDALLNLSFKARVEYLSLLEETQRLRELDAIAAPESKSRDMYDFELAKVLENTSVLDTIEKKRTSINDRYIVALRGVASSGKHNQTTSETLKNWIESKYVQEETNNKLAA